MTPERATRDVRRRWRRYRWAGWRRLICSAVSRAWRLQLFLSDGAADTSGRAESSRGGRPDSVVAGLVVMELSARFRRHQTPLVRNLYRRIQGRGATAWGDLTLSGPAPMWVPRAQARDWEAREFIVEPLPDTNVISHPIGRRWTGVVLYDADGAELWLRIRARDLAKVLASVSLDLSTDRPGVGPR